MKYDSAAEAIAAAKFASLGCTRNAETLPCVFTDAAGEQFNAKADFYHAATGLYIEYKCHKLNGVKTKFSSAKQLTSREIYRHHHGESLTTLDTLNFGWNHAKRKHAIVQAKLTPQNYIVVFDKAIPVADAMVYLSAGIVFCTMRSLPSYLAKVRLTQLGLNLQFNLHHAGDESAPDMILSI